MRKWWWIAVVLVLVGGAFVTYRVLLRPSEAGVSDTALETAVVERGTLRVTVEGSGSLAPRDELGLSFDTAGKVAAVLVEAGDRVTAGMPLARLDDVDARRSVAEAELQVRQAEVSLQSAQMKLDELLNWEPDQDAIEQAQANLAAAQADYHKALASNAHVDDQLASAEVRLAQAQRALEDAQEAYNTAFDPARDWELQDKRLGPRLEAERETAEDRLVTAQENLRLAEASYNLEVAALSDSAVKSAWSKVISARIALEKEQTGPDEDEIRSARLQVEQGEISLEQARLKLEAAQRALADTELVAPVDGTVTAVNIELGQAVGTSQVAVSIADLASFIVEIGLDETDIVGVEVGQPAVVVVDAFDDAEFSGRVIHVSPTASVQSGVVLYEVTIALDATEVPVRAGMTADAEVVTDSAEDVLVIPLKAVRSIGGRHFVLRQLREGEEPQTLFRQGSGGQQGGGMLPGRMSGGGDFQALSPEERAELRAQMQAQFQQVEGFVMTPIELGVTTDAYAEVVQGLEEGDVVLVSVLTDDVGAQEQPAPRGLGIPGIGSGALGGRR